MDTLTTILDEDGPEEVVRQVMKGLVPRIMEVHGVEYRCPCSRERVADALVSIGRESLLEMAAEERDISVDCQFCGKQYGFTATELRTLAGQGK